MKNRYILIGSLLLSVVLWLSGCRQPSSDTAFYKLKTSPEKVREIKTLELESYRSEPQPDIPSVLELPEEPLDKIALELDQCRALALENNLDIKVQLIAPAITQESLNAERAKFEASFTTNLTYNKTDQPTATTLDISGSGADYSNVDMGVEIPFQTGGTITFNLADSRTKTNSEYSIFNPSYSDRTSVSISQYLLKNAGTRTNTHSIRIAEYEKYRTDIATKMEVIRVLAAMDRVYWRLYAASKQVQVSKQRYELAKAQLERAQRFVDAGQYAQIEINRAEAGQAESLQSIIIAENEMRDRQRETKQTLNKSGLETRGATVITPVTEPNPIHYTFDPDRLIEQAFENRTEMLDYELRLAQNISEIDFRRNQTLPLVTLNYTYNVNGLGPTRSDAYDLLTDHRFVDHYMGASLQIPLGNQAAKSNLRAAVYSRMQTIASKERQRSTIEVEVLNALDQVESNWLRVLAARQNTILQERLYQAEIRQFENGLTTSTDVLEAQSNFTNAQSSEINALAEYQIALVDLAYATGTLLGAAQVEWEPAAPAIK
ncbi:MAG: TolC family protein [Planctomycetes bacterium]|nr:TolC family protein [Planctomycetota bacterium]